MYNLLTFQMKRYEECLEDIEASLYFEYPENMRYKLVDRQAKCFQALGRGNLINSLKKKKGWI